MIDPQRAALALGVAVALAGCAAKRQPAIFPGVPMPASGIYETPPSAEPHTSTGVCGNAAKLAPMRADTVDSAALARIPAPIGKLTAAYPPSEKQQGWEGTVDVRFLVRPDGRVARVDVGDGSDPFRNAAAEALCRARFTPGVTASGDSVYVWLERKFAFRLGIALPAGR